MPKDCVAITLLPQCAILPAELAQYSMAAESTCYDDVESIDWTQFSPY